MGGLNVGIGVRIPRHTPSEGGSDLYRLFANGEDGFLFGNFGDLTRLFTAFNGNSSVVNDADPVGLALEDAKWSKRSYSAQLAQTDETIRNQNGSGSVAGTPGTPPTNWTATAQTGYAFEMVGTGTDADGAHTEYRLSGTDAGLRANTITFETSTQIVAASGEVWVNNVGFKIVAGGLTGLNALLGVDENTAAGSYVSGGQQAITPTGTMQRFSLVRAVAGGTTVARIQPWLRFAAPGGVATSINIRIYAPSMKKVAGNHGSQSTTSARPFYKPNSGKPYLLYDGSDDALQTPFVVPAAVTMACAVRATGDGTFIGGGSTGTNTRCRIYQTGGSVAVAWGANGALLSAVAATGADRVALVTGDATSVDLWIDGVLAAKSAPSGSPAGGSAFAIGGWNNGGALTSFGPARHYANMVVNRRVTPAEIALITSRFRSAYQ